MAAKVDNPEARSIQMTEQLRKTKRKEIISKKRKNMALNQTPQEGAGFSRSSSNFPARRTNMDMKTPHNNRCIRLTNTLTTNNE